MVRAAAPAAADGARRKAVMVVAGEMVQLIGSAGAGAGSQES